MPDLRSRFVRCALEANQRGLVLVVCDQSIPDTSYALRPIEGLAEWFATLDGVEGYLRGLAAGDEQPKAGGAR